MQFNDEHLKKRIHKYFKKEIHAESKFHNEHSVLIEKHNQFAKQTTIDYFNPYIKVSAKIIFFNNKGSVLKTIEIKEKGKGFINEYDSNLAKSIYSYSLIFDGIVIETKRIVKL